MPFLQRIGEDQIRSSNSNENINKFFKKEIKTFMDNNIKLCAIGNLSALPQKVYNELSEVIDKTKDNSRMTLTLALSYGSREELLAAFKSIVNEVNDKKISLEKIDESILNKHLYTHFLPDVDLLIRTSEKKELATFVVANRIR